MINRRAVTSESDWLSWRRQYLCASEIGAAIGIDPYRSALSVYAEKRGLIMGPEDNGLMRRGRHFEQAAASYFVEEHPGIRVMHPHVFLMDDDNHLGATPDRVAEDPEHPGLINVQLKIVAKPSFERWDGVPPPYYVLQTACENMLLDADRGILACLVVSSYTADLHCFDVPRHAAAEQQIRTIGQEFNQNLLDGRYPAPDYKRDAETIKAMYPNAEPGTVLDLATDNRLGELLPKRAELKARIKADTEAAEEIDTEIRAKLGDAETALLPGWKVTLKDMIRKSYTVAESRSRRLTVTNLDEDN